MATRECAKCWRFTARGREHCPFHEPIESDEDDRDLDYLDRPGCIYLLQSGSSRYYKLGWTSLAIEDRIAALQAGNPHRIRVIEMIRGTQREEHMLQERHEDRRQGNGEWFRFESREEAIAALLAAEGSHEHGRKAG